MKYVAVYFGLLFIGLPLIMFSNHMATLSDEEKQGLSEAVKDMKGRIYQARISCNEHTPDHVMRIHGRDRDGALSKLQDRLPDCDVEILEGSSDPIWKKALRETF